MGNFSQALDDYAPAVGAWLDAAKKEVAAVARLQKAVASGNARDLEKHRQSALSAADVAAQRAEACPPFEFDLTAYLRDGYIEELQEAAQGAGVKLYERDGVLFCYPALVRLEPELGALRIDKRLEPNIRPELLALQLKKAQSVEPKSRSDRFIESLCTAYNLVLKSTDAKGNIDIPLREIYQVFTLLPGSAKDYTLLDFTRDIYALDTDGLTETKAGARMSLPASTVSRERSSKTLAFVTRDGHEKIYSSVKFSSGDRKQETRETEI